MSFSNQGWGQSPFPMKLFKQLVKAPIGATSKVTQLSSLKPRLDQKWTNSCKKVYHLKYNV